MKTSVWFASFCVTLLLCTGRSHAADIGGTISATVTITEDSQLVDDVTCTVRGAACIAFGASGVTLDLNGFTMTGLGNSETGCSGGPPAPAVENGIFVDTQRSVTVRGPGLIQRFRASGISSNNSSA